MENIQNMPRVLEMKRKKSTEDKENKYKGLERVLFLLQEVKITHYQKEFQLDHMWYTKKVDGPNQQKRLHHGESFLVRVQFNVE